jgi:CRISPR/Cas system-associated protein Cas7 (RAMP superfamily)
LTTNPRIVVVLLAKLKVNLERLNLKNSVSKSQGRGSSEVTRGVFYDVISVNLLKGGFEVYVWKNLDESLVKRVCSSKEQQRCTYSQIDLRS